MISRRRFLTSTALAGAGLGVAGIGFAKGARAFTVEAAPEPVAQLYAAERAAACQVRTYHAQIVAEVQAALNGTKLTEDEKREQVNSLLCPLCGCPVTES